MPNTVERFSNRVENYVKYRPGYPPEILDFLGEKLNLRKDSVIADVGAGTGISTKMFLENGNPVFGIEPNAAMRRAAKDFLRGFARFTCIDGTAENTTLPDQSVDFVAAAQAFHWFDAAKARAEFRRILKPEGFVILIWNERQLDSTPFLRDYERFLVRFGTDYNEVRHENVSETSVPEFFNKGFERAGFKNVQKVDFEGLKGRMLSSSYIPTEENPRFAAMIESLQTLFDKHEKDDAVEILYDTNVYYGRI